MPCYVLVQQQLKPESVIDEPRAQLASGEFVHGISWMLGGRQFAFEGSGRSKKIARNAAARSVLHQLVSEHAEQLDPARNGSLAQWSLEWLNQRLEATMELQEELVEGGADGVTSESRHICTWSCPQVKGETIATGTARSSAESRRQAMASLYAKLPDHVENLITSSQASSDKPSTASDIGSEVSVMHNEAVQKLGIQAKHEIDQLPSGDFQCTLTWQYFDEGQRSQKRLEAIGIGRSKALAKTRAHHQMLVQQGHLPNLSEDFRRTSAEIQRLLDTNRVAEALSQAVALLDAMDAQSVAGLTFFLPETLRAVLAEGNAGALRELLAALSTVAEKANGIPVELWEGLLDESSFAIRHYGLSGSTIEQLKDIPLMQSAFPSEAELNYFRRFRHLLALERHGGLMHGIQQYELEQQSFNSVPVVDVHKLEGSSSMVALTSTPEAGAYEILEGARALKANDLVLLVPLESLSGFTPPSADEALYGFGAPRSTNWQSPEAWMASITSVKGNPRAGEEVRINTRRISRFGSDVEAAEGVASPISLGRQYRLFYISMETPMSRMLTALRCLCQVQLPVWAPGFEGRKPSLQYTEELRRILLANADEARTVALQAPRAIGNSSASATFDMVANARPFLRNLTPSQRLAVERAFQQRLSLIQGPPGTGKTYVACAIISAWVHCYVPVGERILAVADSNVAADNLHNRLLAFGIESVRVGQTKDGSSAIVGDMLFQAVRNASVVIATCIGSGMDVLDSKANFQRVVIDECTQACETAAVVALGRRCEQVVLIGDHAQLPATVLSKLAARDGLGISLFERMVNGNSVEPTVLQEQRRMHSSISEFPNKAFYASQLLNAIDDSSLPPVPGFPWTSPDMRVCFVDVASTQEGRRGYSSFNTVEAAAIADVVQNVVRAGMEPEKIGILTAYLAQKNEIMRAFRERFLGHLIPVITIDTVDGYQGMERDLILFSATRSNTGRVLGFLADPRRMNVMLTRAKRGVVVFGNGDTLRNSQSESHWPSWLDWVESKQAIISFDKLAERTSQAINSATSTSSSANVSTISNSTSIGSTSAETNNPSSNFPEPILTGSSTTASSMDWIAPPPPSAPQKPQDEWVKVYSQEYGAHYYWNKTTNHTQWEQPTQM